MKPKNLNSLLSITIFFLKIPGITVFSPKILSGHKVFLGQMRLKILYIQNQNALENGVWLWRWPNLFFGPTIFGKERLLAKILWSKFSLNQKIFRNQHKSFNVLPSPFKPDHSSFLKSFQAVLCPSKSFQVFSSRSKSFQISQVLPSPYK